MYLFIGQDVIVDEEKIIGIFDIENTSVSKHTRDFLKRSQQDGSVVNVTSELPKSYVVCRDTEKNHRVYVSQLAAATLKRRSERPLVVDS